MMFDDVRDLYQTIILERSRNPRHMHRLEPCDAAAEGDNPLCGDRVEVRLRYDDRQRVAEAAFEARGCAISVASADLMAELVRGHGADEIRRMADGFAALVRTGTTDDDALETLTPLAGVSEYPSRIKCATLPWAALAAALAGRREASSELS
jgi:nitrogen fixation NifU-like protein